MGRLPLWMGTNLRVVVGLSIEIFAAGKMAADLSGDGRVR
jgi:hypothetical protein